ncbi:unnamed protein product [Lota lota]
MKAFTKDLGSQCHKIPASRMDTAETSREGGRAGGDKRGKARPGQRLMKPRSGDMLVPPLSSSASTELRGGTSLAAAQGGP